MQPIWSDRKSAFKESNVTSRSPNSKPALWIRFVTTSAEPHKHVRSRARHFHMAAYHSIVICYTFSINTLTSAVKSIWPIFFFFPFHWNRTKTVFDAANWAREGERIVKCDCHLCWFGLLNQMRRCKWCANVLFWLHGLPLKNISTVANQTRKTNRYKKGRKK